MKRLLPGLCLACLLLAGCSETVSEAPPSEKPFTLYGTLNPMADTQWVFVYPVDRRLQQPSKAPLDAAVTTTEAATGAQQTWTERTYQDWRGDIVHGYWAAFRPRFDAEYSLSVRRSDGAESASRTRIPPFASIATEPIVPGVYSIWAPVVISTKANYLLKVEVTYDITTQLPGERPVRSRFTLLYRDQARTAAGWRIPIDLGRDRYYIQIAFTDENYPLDVTLHDLELRAVVANEEWNPPGGVFDHEVLVDPTIMTNVRNGYGFFSAGFPLQVNWLPEPDVLAAAGFLSPPAP